MIFASFFPYTPGTNVSRTLSHVFFNPWSPMKAQPVSRSPVLPVPPPILFPVSPWVYVSLLPTSKPHWLVLGKTYPWSMWALGWGWQNGGMKTVLIFFWSGSQKEKYKTLLWGLRKKFLKWLYREFGYLRELFLIKREILLIKGNQAHIV